MYEIKISVKKEEDLIKLFFDSGELFEEVSATITPLNDETLRVIDENTDYVY